jgi:tRNA dimethylallyltransferase
MQKTCIIISGPTAVGKTAIAIALAKYFSTEIISADSRQCYRELNIGVAKPEPEELAIIPHHFINTHSVNDSVNAADFGRYSLETVEHLFKEKDVVVMAGGTGLYIKAFAQGLDDVPPTDPEVRTHVETGYSQGGLKWLQQQVRNVDPDFETKGEFENPRRLMRALEVFLISGKPIAWFHNRQPAHRPFRILNFMIDRPRELLYQRINDRVDAMISKGLISEVEGLIPYRHLPALQTVGYTELFKYLEGNLSKEAAIDLIRQNTRHYAKRQLTWFRNSGACVPCSSDPAEALKCILGYL